MELLSTGQDPGKKSDCLGNSSVVMKISVAEIPLKIISYI